MKYIEELDAGDSFELLGEIYVLTTDFKNNGSRMCINLKTGQIQWFNGSSVVDISQLFIMDKNNHLIAIKETKKHDIN